MCWCGMHEPEDVDVFMEADCWLPASRIEVDRLSARVQFRARAARRQCACTALFGAEPDARATGAARAALRDRVFSGLRQSDRQVGPVGADRERPQRLDRRAADHPAIELVGRVVTRAVKRDVGRVVRDSALHVHAERIERCERIMVDMCDDDRVFMPSALPTVDPPTSASIGKASSGMTIVLLATLGKSMISGPLSLQPLHSAGSTERRAAKECPSRKRVATTIVFRRIPHWRVSHIHDASNIDRDTNYMHYNNRYVLLQ